MPNISFSDEPCHRPEGPEMRSYRDTTIEDLQDEIRQYWDKCLAEDVTLPLLRVRVYDSNGEVSYIRKYNLFGSTDSTETEEVNVADHVLGILFSPCLIPLCFKKEIQIEYELL